jgi:hypothetical protein
MTAASQASKLTRSRRALAFVAAAAVWASSAPAQAKPEFPAIIQEVSGAPCEPPCLLCHETNSPSQAPITAQPFYVSLGAHFGFLPPATSEEQLRLKLTEYQQAGFVDADGNGVCDTDAEADGVCDVDINGNGINDIDDLAANVNPNNDDVLCDLPAYGCGASRIEPRGNVEDYGVFLSAFAAMALLLRTRRRRPARR